MDTLSGNGIFPSTSHVLPGAVPGRTCAWLCWRKRAGEALQHLELLLEWQRLDFANDVGSKHGDGFVRWGANVKPRRRCLPCHLADDRAIWEFAKVGEYTVVTQDSDFAEMAFLYGPPPKVIWLRCGNQTTEFIENLLRNHAESVAAFEGNADAVCGLATPMLMPEETTALASKSQLPSRTNRGPHICHGVAMRRQGNLSNAATGSWWTAV
jgi:predicted nuclease of predicted toxin-antitoxin system